MDVHDAVFESMSGITTTGSTVIPLLEIVITRHFNVAAVWLSLVEHYCDGSGCLANVERWRHTLLPESYETPDKAIPRATNLLTVFSDLYIADTIWAFMFRLAGITGL